MKRWLVPQLRRRDFPGSSGSGLFDANGNLIGITTIAVTTEDGAANIGFAIPVELALEK